VKVSRPRVPLAVMGAIAVGGAAGTCGRAAVALALPAPTSAFPWATFVVNLSGSFVLGVVMVLVLERFSATRLVRPLLATGLCGAFTTFSSLVTQVDLLVRAGRAGLGAIYLIVSTCGGIAAVLAGSATGRRMPLGRLPLIRRTPERTTD
jgi:CrcB protein